ncbi:MAG: DUF4248 domain-containing protein [Prevotella sp.]|jgi:hypothetical protein|nr:DUF4248 domain-containing protein [Prevotella sp.]
MKNDEFVIRAYGRSELALLYSPDISAMAAYKRLCRWIAHYPGLQEQLERVGHSSHSRQYTPMQVKLIVEALGEP